MRFARTPAANLLSIQLNTRKNTTQEIFMPAIRTTTGNLMAFRRTPPGAKRPARYFAATLVAAFVCFAAAHCATTPLQEFLHAQAPEYRALQPVSSKDLRGAHLIDIDSMNPATNRCFRGELDRQTYASFREYTQSYSGGFAAGTELARDFGGLLGAGEIAAEAGRTFNGAITLGEVEEHRLNNVFFDPSSVCAQDESSFERLQKGDARFTVVTRALRAGTIRVSSEDASHLNLQLAVTEVGGKLQRSTQDERSWSGVELFFAALPQTYRVKVKEIKQEVGQRQEIKLGRCAATLLAYSPVRRVWNGSLNCEGGENFAFRNQPEREWAGAGLPQGGVSYGVKFSPVRTKPGVFAAHLIQWTAIETGD
jgi:hypothetical protein